MDADVKVGQFVGLLSLIALSGVLAPELTRKSLRAFLVGRATWLFAMFLGIAFVGAPFGERPIESAFYVIATAAAFVSMSNFWRIDRVIAVRTMAILALILVGSMVLAVLRYGVGVGRFVGAMTPNHTANIALAGLFAAFWTRSRILRLLSFAGAIYVILMVNSRGSLLTLLIFIGTYACIHAYYRTFHRRRIVTGILAVYPVAIFGIVVIASKVEQLLAAFSSVLALHDPGRGLASGMTGRVDLWVGAFRAVMERPFFGYGYRATGIGVLETAHNAFLNLVQEVGLPAFTVFALFYCTLLVRHIRYVRRAAVHDDFAFQDIFAVVIAVIVSLLALAFVEVHLVNIGFVLGLMNLLVLSFDPSMRLGPLGHRVHFAADSRIRPGDAESSFPIYKYSSPWAGIRYTPGDL